MIAQRRADLLADATHEFEVDATVGEVGRADADERECCMAAATSVVADS